MPARVLDAVASLVGEAAEVDLPRMRRHPQHEDVRARAENAILRAADHDAAHLRMLEADAVERIVELDVHAQVIAVQFQPVAGSEAAVLGDVQRQRCNGALARKLPVPVSRRVGTVVDHGLGGHRTLSGRQRAKGGPLVQYSASIGCALMQSSTPAWRCASARSHAACAAWLRAERRWYRSQDPPSRRTARVPRGCAAGRPWPPATRPWAAGRLARRRAAYDPRDGRAARR